MLNTVMTDFKLGSKTLDAVFLQTSAALFMAMLLLANPVYSAETRIFDVHEHIVLAPRQTRRLVTLMDREGIAAMVLLDTPGITFGDGDAFDGYDAMVERQLAMKRRWPGRLRVFYTFPPYDADGPRKAARLAGRGIDGLKFYNGVLWEQLGAIDSRAMYAAFAVAREHRLPVIIHVEAMNPIQRREFERALDDFPAVTFICPHLCGVERNLRVLEAMLKRHRNLMTDGGPWHRVGAFATAEPEKFREFYIAHSDRIMFATDSVIGDDLDESDLTDRIECERGLLEHKYFSCFRSESVMRGLYLPRAALDDIYHRTAERIFGAPAAAPERSQ
jgi:predicted TIM-barrel fold metal-dependent hydrolase